jgi:hypothetical protein
MTDKDAPRLYVTAGLFVLFGYVLYHNVDNDMLIGAIIGSFGTAVAFWLGSSKGSSDKSSQIERAAIEPQSVTVINPPSDPVQTEEAQS